MNSIMTDLSNQALSNAIQQSFFDFGWQLHEHWGAVVSFENEKLRRWWMPIPFAFIFNAALSLLPPAGDEASLIDDTLAFFQSRDRTEFDWWLWPGLEASAWPRLLTAHGLTLESDPPGMAIELDRLPESASMPDGVKVTLVQNPAEMKTWTQTFVPGYQLPPAVEADITGMMLATMHMPVTSYLAWADGQPIATSSVFLDAGVAGIYNVATLPAWRGKGIGAAMTLLPLLDARRQGYRAGILQSSALGYPVYQRLGFRQLCTIDHYHWQAQADA